MNNQPNKNRLRPLLLVAVLLAVTVGGIELARRLSQPGRNVDSRAQSPTVAFPREIKDAGGALLKINARPQRIVSQTLGTDEILLALCEPARIIAVSSIARDPKYSLVVEEAKNIPAQTDKGAEQIIQLKPDLVFVASYNRAETVELLKAAGAPVFRFANFDRIDDIKTNIRTVGYAIGEDAKAEALVREMEDRIKAVQARLPKRDQPLRVMSYSPGGFSAGANTLFDEMLRAVGAINVSAEQGLKSFPKIGAEKVLEWQPDVIVLGADQNGFVEERNRLLASPAVAATKAARAGRIVTIDNRYYLTVSHQIAHTIELLAEGLYGKLP